MKQARDKITQEIMKKYDKLTSENKMQFIEMLEALEFESQVKKLRRNPIPEPEQLAFIKSLVKNKQSDVMLYTDIFTYGMIEGKRAERKKKRIY